MAWFDGLISKFSKAFDQPGADVVGEKFAEAGGGFVGGIKSWVGGLWNMGAATAHADGDAFGKGLNQFGQGFGEWYGKGNLGGLEAIASLPVLKQTFALDDVIQKEFIKRPLATGMLQTGNALRGEDVYSVDAWRKAYNESAYVTVGQAQVYETQAGFDAVLGGDMAEKIDPRDLEKRRQFMTDPALKYTSGALDFAFTAVADPLALVGPVGKAGKLRYISKPMTAAAIKRGDDVKFLDSAKARESFQFMRDAKHADEVHQTMFNAVPEGGQAADLLTSAAKIEDEDMAWRVWRNTLHAAWGNRQAAEGLVADSEALGTVLGKKYANQTMGDVAARASEGDPKALAVLDARRETDTEAFVDAMQNGYGTWGQLMEGKAPMLAGRNVPRLTLTSKMRYQTHSLFNGGLTFFVTNPVGRLANRGLRNALPSSTSTRIVNLDDISSTADVRRNLETARLVAPQHFTDDHVAMWTNRYARQTSRESRFSILNQAENHAWAAIASKFGHSPAEIVQSLAAVSKNRQTAYGMFGRQSRRFLTDDIRQLATKRILAGDSMAGGDLERTAREMQAAIDRGDMPASVLVQHDDDLNPIIMPDFGDANQPLLSSQHAQRMPMMDWRTVNDALWWNHKGPLGEKSYKVYDTARTLMDTANTVWKVSALLRPGYMWRMMSDDVLRRTAVFGAGTVAMQTATGLAHSGVNMYDRVARNTWRRYSNKANSLRGGNATQPANITQQGMPNNSLALHTAPTLFDVTAQGAGKDISVDATMMKVRRKANEQPPAQTYKTWERALGDGAIHVDDYLEAVEHHAVNVPGSLHPDTANVVQARRDGFLDEVEANKQILDNGLRMARRDSYNNPTWVQSVLDDVADRGKNLKPNSAGRSVVVDPFEGTAAQAGGLKFGLSKGRVLSANSEHDELYQWVHENMDELLLPNSLMHMYMGPDGRYVVGVADTATAKNVPAIKSTSGVRIQRGIAKKYVDSGSHSVAVRLPDGQVHEFEGAFEGTQGDLYRSFVKGDQASATAMDLVHDRTIATLDREMRGDMVQMSHTQTGWDEALERAVNAQIGNDKVTRQFLAGKSIEDVRHWLANSQEGRAYWAKMGPWQSQPYAQLTFAHAMVDKYVPDVGNLRKLALDQKLTAKRMRELVSEPDLPMVHGAEVQMGTFGKAGNLMTNAVNKIFKVIADIPSDKASRFPFFDESYRRHLSSLGGVMQAQSKGHVFSVKELENVQTRARQLALADVRKYLYDGATSHDLAKLGRLAVPFGGAASDSYLKWGVIMREKPWVANQLYRLWTLPDRGGMVVDQDNNHKEWDGAQGRYRWYREGIDGGKEYLPEDYEPSQEAIVMSLPGGSMGNGIKSVAKINKNTFNTFLSYPTAGPLVAVPMSKFALNHAEYADNKFIKNFVLPIGPVTADQALVPGVVRSAYQVFKGADGDVAEGQAAAYYQTQWVEFRQGRRAEAPTFAEARAAANRLKIVRFAYQMAGVTPQFQTPYQPYVDHWHMLQQTDPANAVGRWYNEVDPEFRIFSMSLTRNNSGLPANVATQKMMQKYKGLIEQNPDIAGLIVGTEGAGEYAALIRNHPEWGKFSEAVYQWQKGINMGAGSSDKMREPQSLEESVKENARIVGWQEYSRFMDAVHTDMEVRGLTSLSQKGAARIKASRDRWIKQRMYWDQNPSGTAGRQLSPWYEDFQSSDQAKTTRLLTQMTNIALDPQIQGRDDVRGLIDYLSARQAFKRQMDRQGIGSLSSAKAASMKAHWDAEVFGLKSENLSFAALHNRWLQGDENLDADLV